MPIVVTGKHGPFCHAVGVGESWITCCFDSVELFDSSYMKAVLCFAIHTSSEIPLPPVILFGFGKKWA